jgi:hypothetical protein
MAADGGSGRAGAGRWLLRALAEQALRVDDTVLAAARYRELRAVDASPVDDLDVLCGLAQVQTDRQAGRRADRQTDPA